MKEKRKSNKKICPIESSHGKLVRRKVVGLDSKKEKEVSINYYACEKCNRFFVFNNRYDFLEKLSFNTKFGKMTVYNGLDGSLKKEGRKIVLRDGKDVYIYRYIKNKLDVHKSNFINCIECKEKLTTIFFEDKKNKNSISGCFCKKCKKYYFKYNDVINNPNYFIDVAEENRKKEIEAFKIKEIEELKKYTDSDEILYKKHFRILGEFESQKKKIEAMIDFKNINSIITDFKSNLKKIDNELIEYEKIHTEKIRKAKEQTLVLTFHNCINDSMDYCPNCFEKTILKKTEMFSRKENDIVPFSYFGCNKCGKNYLTYRDKVYYYDLMSDIIGITLDKYEIPKSLEPIGKVYVSVVRNTGTLYCVKQKHPQDFVSMELINMENGTKEKQNVCHCIKCNKYWITYRDLENKTRLLFKPTFLLDFSNEFNENEQSVMKLYGYTVGNNGLDYAKRHSIIDMLLSNNMMTASEMLSLLKWNIKKAESKTKADMSAAINDWERDIDYILYDYPAKKSKLIGVIK